jgi:hypothetical protein
MRKTLEIMQERWDKEGPFGPEKAEAILKEIRAPRAQQ